MFSIMDIASRLELKKPLSVKSDIMPAGGDNSFKSLRKKRNWIINTQDIFIFSSSDIKVHVPPKGLGGPRPKREIEMKLESSSDYIHSSPYYEHAYYHSNGLDDEKSVTDINENGPGLSYWWQLKNDTSFPPGGRTGKMKVNLLVKRKPDYNISAPTFSSIYSTIRDRFFSLFFHGGQVAQEFWPDPEVDKLKFSDQLIYMGQTLIVLSSELHIYALRRENHRNTQLVDLIFTILNTIEHDLIDQDTRGYLVRDRISGKDDSRLSKSFKEVESDFQNGRDNELSVDNLLGILVGLLHISLYLDKSDTSQKQASDKASSLIDGFFRYLMSNKFIVKRPDGERVKRGDDAQGFVTLLHGLFKLATGNDVFEDLEVDLGVGGHQGVIWVGSIWDAGGVLSDLLRVLGQYTNQFSIHMALSLLCSSEVWSQQEIEKSRNKRHLLSIALYAYHHNTAPMGVPWESVNQLLSSCDENGPSNKNEVWNRDNLWVRGGPGTPSGGPKILYNGLDFMVLHNLAQIVHQRSFYK